MLLTTCASADTTTGLLPLGSTAPLGSKCYWLLRQANTAHIDMTGCWNGLDFCFFYYPFFLAFLGHSSISRVINLDAWTLLHPSAHSLARCAEVAECLFFEFRDP